MQVRKERKGEERGSNLSLEGRGNQVEKSGGKRRKEKREERNFGMY